MKYLTSDVICKKSDLVDKKLNLSLRKDISLYGHGQYFNPLKERKVICMGFVRWRGRCAQLLATDYEDGRSKQITLTKLSEFYVPEATKRDVEKKYPDIEVDWAEISRSLAKGPPDIMKSKIPDKHLNMAVVENYLREWAAEIIDKGDSNSLNLAASVLTKWRAELYQVNERLKTSE